MDTIIIVLISFCIVSSHGLESGSPCEAEYSMQPSRTFHGTAQNSDENPAPYKFAFLDSYGREVNEYTNEMHTVQLSGDVPFRGFLIQARLATPQAFVIGHLRAGHFVYDQSRWSEQGIKMQRCPPFANDSITHSDNKEKYVISAKWQTLKKEGPIQFIITVVQSRDIFWSQWQPRSGFLVPSSKAKFESQHSGSDQDEKSDDTGNGQKSDETWHEKPIPFLGTDEEIDTKDAEKFVVPRFNISLKAGKGISVQVVHAQKQIKKFPVPPVFNVEDPFEDSEDNELAALARLGSGDAKELDDHLCKDHACKNNGTCKVLPRENQYECICTDYWLGEFCEEPNHCYKNGEKCRNEAQCIIDDNGFHKCQCNGEWAGEFCEIPCPSSLCRNGGNCAITVDNKYGCACPAGYTGRTCDIDIDECYPNPCLNGGTCVDKINDFECKCVRGYMGDRCQRPCQDIYKSCEFWGEQDRCEIMRPSTRFFDINCAVTCGQCEYDNSTVITDLPLPPILEPFKWLLGRWTLNSTRPYRFPLDFLNATAGYYEILDITASSVIMFGTPSLNFRYADKAGVPLIQIGKSRAVNTISYNNRDPDDQQITFGFLTLGPGTKPLKISLMTTGNEGITVMEEGEMEDTKLDLEMVYVASKPELDAFVPTKVKRHFTFQDPYLQESIERHGAKDQKDYFTKYFYREK